VNAAVCPKCLQPIRPVERATTGHSRIIVWGNVFLVLFVVYFLMHVKLF
jgi:hypothetical protein